MPTVDHYRVLGVDRSAGPEELRRAYRRLLRRYHPDVYQGDRRVAEANTRQLREAYETLNDPVRRREYDHLSSSPKAGPGAPRRSPPPVPRSRDLSDLESYRLRDYVVVDNELRIVLAAVLSIGAALLLLVGVLWAPDLAVPGQAAEGAAALASLGSGAFLGNLALRATRDARARWKEERRLSAREVWRLRSPRYAEWTERTWSERPRPEEPGAHVIRLPREERPRRGRAS
ncbi:MAG: DnaJ domain-containing protein [Euryarchaeota archaeon]|nr:DnaJ domain-containing protein [Euryarchaeota archaeon]